MREADLPGSIVLASASPRRASLLREAGIAFRVLPAAIDETIPPGREPLAAARDLAEAKAQAVRPRVRGVVLAADTLVVAGDGEILGKPIDAQDARRMLRKLSGTTHSVVTGVAVDRDEPPARVVDLVETRITMRPMTAAEIDAYVASGESDGKAGGYAIQETADRFVTRVEGSWSNVVGLPMERVLEILRDFGVHAGVLLLCVLGLFLAGCDTGRSAQGPGNRTVALRLLPHDAPRNPGDVPTAWVEVASTRQAVAQGLSGRKSLPADGGMLFVYPESSMRTFWMKDCSLALDIAFLDEGGRILGLATLPPGEGLAYEDIPRASSPAPARYVLETGAGWMGGYGIGPGARVDLSAVLAAPR